MTQTQERTLSMYLLIVQYLQNNATVVSVPGFQNLLNRFENTVNDIRDIEQLRINDDSAIQSASKKDLRMQCLTALENILDMLKAHADISNDTVLAQKTNIQFSLLKRLADTAFAADCDKYYQIAVSNAAALVPYGITAAYLADFRQVIDAYISVITQPRAAIISRADNTVILRNLFVKGKKEMESLTLQVTTKRITAPNFYSQFIKSSKIIDNGSTLRALSIALKAEDGTPLRAFTFTFTRIADGKIFEYKTNENGNIVRQFFKDGIYTLTITKVGYTPYTDTIQIEAGTTYKIAATANTIDKIITI
jgi:hypothetical protein